MRTFPAGRQGLPRGNKNTIKKFAQRHFTYFSLHQYLALTSSLFLLRKAELILLLPCWAICQKETVSFLRSASGKVQRLISWRRVSGGCMHMVYRWKALTRMALQQSVRNVQESVGTCVSANAVSTPEKNPHRQECAEETCTSTAARDRYTTSPALCRVSVGKGQMGVLRALFLPAYYSLDVKRWLLNFSVLICQ